MKKIDDPETVSFVGKFRQHFAHFECEECGDIYDLRVDVGYRWNHCGCQGGKKLDINKRIFDGSKNN